MKSVQCLIFVYLIPLQPTFPVASAHGLPIGVGSGLIIDIEESNFNFLRRKSWLSACKRNHTECFVGRKRSCPHKWKSSLIRTNQPPQHSCPFYDYNSHLELCFNSFGLTVHGFSWQHFEKLKHLCNGCSIKADGVAEALKESTSGQPHAIIKKSFQLNWSQI